MFELLEGYRHVAHLAEWSGMSLGALAACGAGIYFGLSNPKLLRLAIPAAIGVACAYGGLMHGAKVTRADDQAEWAAERKAAAAARVTFDASTKTAIAATYDPIAALLQRNDAARQTQVNHDWNSKTARICPLGDAPLRLRQRPARK